MRKVLHIGDEMDINKERKLFQDFLIENFDFEHHEQTYFDEKTQCYENDHGEDTEVVNVAWEVWKAAKKQATPEGFVLVPKDELTTTYYWEGAEHTVNCVSEYEMELEKGEIAELEKWEQTKSTKAFFANIYSDEDNFEIVEFDSIEAAELAINENKAMIEAQEQSHG